MIVQHNLQAMNANRMLGITAGKVSSSTEKLSSGYQINRAADDAAGLAISEKMRKQIRGLDRASANAEDGVSCVQTAEGAMAEVQDMLQRMNELCVQAANGTNSVTDRGYIQDEIDQLVIEIDRVAETTKFNDTYLLKGDETAQASRQYTTNYIVDKTKNLLNGADSLPRDIVYKGGTIKDQGPLDYKIRYRGQNNIYMVNSAILDTNHNQPINAEVVRAGDELTKYMYQTTGPSLEANDAQAALDISKYQAFVNVELNSEVGKGKNGKVYGEVPATKGSIRYDLSTDGTDEIVRASQTLYIFDTEKETVTRMEAGADMTNYLYSDNTLKERYRLVDILDGNEERFAQYRGNEDEVHQLSDELYQYSTSKSLSYTDVNGQTRTRSVYIYSPAASITYNTNVYNTYYSCPTKTINDDNKNKRQWAYSIPENSYERQVGRLINNTTQQMAVNTGYALRVKQGITGTGATMGNAQSGEVFTLTASDGLPMSKTDFEARYGLALNDTNFEVVSLRTRELTEDGSYRMVYLSDMVSLSGTSDKVSSQLLGGGTGTTDRKNWVWDNSVIEFDYSMNKLYNADGEEVSSIALNDYFDENGRYKGGLFKTSEARDGMDEIVGDDIIPYITQTSDEVAGDLNINLHVGADSDLENKINVEINSLTAAGLGVDKLHSTSIGIVDETGANAADAINVIAAALEKISTQRSSLGAVQNRLEHTIKNLDNVVENTQDAESSIRDTDMAEEMVNYSNSNVLQQAGQSMLAQANQANQGILSLLS